MAEETIVNTEKTTSKVQYSTFTTPVLDILKDKLPILISIGLIVGSTYLAFFRLDALEHKVAAQEIEISNSVIDQQEFREEVRVRLSVIETKQDITNKDIQQVINLLRDSNKK